MKKKELKRIDWDIVKRLLMLLYYDGGIKRTHVSMKANMSYAKCVLYFDWLEMIGLIRKEIVLDQIGWNSFHCPKCGIDYSIGRKVIVLDPKPVPRLKFKFKA